MGNNNIWYTPIRAYSCYLKEVERHGIDKVKAQGRFQKVRETRALATLCFAMYKQMGTPWYLQLDKSEITDGTIMRLSEKQHGLMELLNVEITSYMMHNDGSLPKQSLLEQLKKTKTFSDHHKYGEHDLILVDLGGNMQVDFHEIYDYLRSIKAPYQLWAIEEIEPEHEDTIVKITICSTKLGWLRIDIGEAWHEQYEQNIRGTLVGKRTANPSKVGIQASNQAVKQAPWD